MHCPCYLLVSHHPNYPITNTNYEHFVMQCSLCSCCIFSRNNKLAGPNLLAATTMTLTFKKISVVRILYNVGRYDDRQWTNWKDAVGKRLASIHVSLLFRNFINWLRKTTKYLSHDSRSPSGRNRYALFLVQPNPKCSPNNPILHTPIVCSRHTLIVNRGLFFSIIYQIQTFIAVHKGQIARKKKAP
jgi:hypothetical protein